MDGAHQPPQSDPRAGGPDRPQPLRDPHRGPLEPRAIASLFRFTQVEVPWLLGPPAGRYLVRTPGGGPSAAPSHVVMIAALDAPSRGPVVRRGTRRRKAAAHPPPAPVSTGRATVIEVRTPLRDVDDARAWLARAGEPELAGGLEVLARALDAYRVVVADPYLPAVGRDHLLVARIGYGAGEQVAEGAWTDAVALTPRGARERRLKAIVPQARLAAVLGEHQRLLACETMTLRARLDLDGGRSEQAALQLSVALEAALAELARDAVAAALEQRLDELATRREPVAAAARAALSRPLDAGERSLLAQALERLEAALRARAAAYSSTR